MRTKAAFVAVQAALLYQQKNKDRFLGVSARRRRWCLVASSPPNKRHYYAPSSLLFESASSSNENDSSSRKEVRPTAPLLQTVTTSEESAVNKGGSVKETTVTDADDDDISDVTVSVVLLNCVAILWGSQHAVIKSVIVDTANPAVFTLLRFGLAAVLASPYTPGLISSPPILQWFQKDNNDDEKAAGIDNNDTKEGHVNLLPQHVSTRVSKTWRWGLEMGFWMFLGFAFQAIGLEYTTAQKSGFLLYLNVKFVPFLAAVLYRRQISAATWLSALTAFTGTALLATTTTTGDNKSLDLNLNVGDLWSIAAAAASAMFILRLERASAEIPNAAALNAACLWVVTALSIAWSFAQVGMVGAAEPNSNLWWSELRNVVTQHPLELIYLGGITTAFANWIQTKAQRDVSAERAAVIYAMDPVYGAGFAYLLLGETLNGITGWLGAGLITVAAATNAFLDVSRTMEEEEESHRVNGNNNDTLHDR